MYFQLVSLTVTLTVLTYNCGRHRSCSLVSFGYALQVYIFVVMFFSSSFFFFLTAPVTFRHPLFTAKSASGVLTIMTIKRGRDLEEGNVRNDLRVKLLNVMLQQLFGNIFSLGWRNTYFLFPKICCCLT